MYTGLLIIIIIILISYGILYIIHLALLHKKIKATDKTTPAEGDLSDTVLAKVIEVTPKILELIPKYSWLAIVLVSLCIFYPVLKEDILPYVTSIKYDKLEIDINRGLSELEKNPLILAYNQKNPDSKYGDSIGHYISPEQRKLIISRGAKLHQKLKTTKILWVDPNMDTIADLRRILETWGVKINTAKSDEEAYYWIRNSLEHDTTTYDLIITNNHHEPLRRDSDGIRFARSLRTGEFKRLDIPIILFSASYGNNKCIAAHGIPENIFAATNRCDYLFHFIFDALERGNAPYPAYIQRCEAIQDTTKRKPAVKQAVQKNSKRNR
jgi:CheY-like chemotaxis protein